MNILEHGKFGEKTITFKCLCGCKFEAYPSEYETFRSKVLVHNTTYTGMDIHYRETYVAHCPECGELLMAPERAIKFKETDRIDNLQKLFLEANNYVIVESENHDIKSGIYQVKVTVLKRSYDKNGINFKFNLALYSKDDCRLITLGQNFNFDSLAIYKYHEKEN